MGIYLKNSDAYAMYKSEASRPFFVDKSLLLEELIPLVEEGNNFICITRPRRFGKTVIANMIGAYFSNACDSSDVFDTLKIAGIEKYKEHLNVHDVIYIDFSEIDDECRSYREYIRNIKSLLKEDLHAMYPEVEFRKNGSVAEDMKRVYARTQKKFIFVLDEWDAIFHVSFVTEKERNEYLRFLRGLLKGKPYVSLAYMTGILPIAKYSSGSELNMFLEYTMATEERFSEYFGFTETEVDELYHRYLKRTKEQKITREGLKIWYDGYHTCGGKRIYNPRSVVASLSNNNLGSYWTSSGPYDEIFYYMEKNVADIRDDLALMMAGEPVAARVQEYAATSMNLQSKDEIFSAMVVYGFLSYDDGRVYIPNKELLEKFIDVLRKESSLGYVYRLSKESNRMLRATFAGDTDTMEQILAYAHNTETPLLQYNNESELSAIVNLVYLAARDTYEVHREDKAGIGYVDYIFTPKQNKNADCIILELKVDDTPEKAIQQIIDKQYALRFRGKLGEEPQYTGRVLAVGISYYKDSKKHRCKVVVL